MMFKTANVHNETETQKIFVVTNYSRMLASFSSSSQQKKKFPGNYVAWNCFSGGTALLYAPVERMMKDKSRLKVICTISLLGEVS